MAGCRAPDRGASSQPSYELPWVAGFCSIRLPERLFSLTALVRVDCSLLGSRNGSTLLGMGGVGVLSGRWSPRRMKRGLEVCWEVLPPKQTLVQFAQVISLGREETKLELIFFLK